jgi:hypothetical protein
MQSPSARPHPQGHAPPDGTLFTDVRAVWRDLVDVASKETAALVVKELSQMQDKLNQAQTALAEERRKHAESKAEQTRLFDLIDQMLRLKRNVEGDTPSKKKKYESQDGNESGSDDEAQSAVRMVFPKDESKYMQGKVADDVTPTDFSDPFDDKEAIKIEVVDAHVPDPFDLVVRVRLDTCPALRDRVAERLKISATDPKPTLEGYLPYPDMPKNGGPIVVFLGPRFRANRACNCCGTAFRSDEKRAYGYKKMEDDTTLVVCKRHPYHLVCAAQMKLAMTTPCSLPLCFGSGKKGSAHSTKCG